MVRYLVVLIFAVLLVAACSDEEDPSASSDSAGATATAEATPSPQDIVDDAAAAVADVESFHFLLTHENGSSPMPLGLELVSAEGDIVIPDRLQAEIEARASSIGISVDAIAIEDQTWITNPFSGDWQELPGASISDIADPTTLVQTLVSSLEDVTATGQEDVDGVETNVIEGRINSATLADALSFAEPGQDIDVTVWIGVEDHLPRRARIDGALTGDDNEDVVRVIELSQFNQPFEINAPE